MSQVRLEDHFTAGKIFRAVIGPIGMVLFSSFYSIADGIFLSQKGGEGAFSGANLIFPLLMIFGSFGFMFGSGGNALVSKTLGEKDLKRANRYFSLVVYSAFVFGILLAIISYFVVEPMANFFASIEKDAVSSSDRMIESAITYGHILSLGLPLFLLQNMFTSFFSTAQKPGLGFFVTFLAGITNIVFDAIFILGCNGSVTGAAIATVMGQALGALIPLFYFFFSKKSLIHLGKTRFEGKPLLKVMSNGSSEFVSNTASAIVGLTYNIQLLRYIGEDGVASYAILQYIGYLFMAIYLGYSLGLAPVVGYHYGAKNHKELHNLLTRSLIFLAMAGLLMFSLSEALATVLASLFSGSNESLKALSERAIRIYCTIFLTSGFSIFASGYFTALSNGLVSAIISFVRTFVFELVFVFTLPLLWGADGIWAAAPFAEIGSSSVTLFFFLREKKRYGY